MPLIRLVPAALLTVVLVAACASPPAGWTVAPVTPSPTPAATAVATASPAASPTASPAGSPSGTALDVKAQAIAFDQTSLEAPAGTPFQIVFDNQDANIPHNVAIKDAGGTTVFNGEIFNGIGTRTYDVPALGAGTYTFVCVVHPTMTGTLTVK